MQADNTIQLDLIGFQKTRLTVRDLLTAISRHTPRSCDYVNPQKQAAALGRFNNPSVVIPFVHADGSDVVDMKLFGLLNATPYKSLWLRGNAPHVYVGVTGSGKTYQILRHAQDGFICYSTATDKDKYYQRLISKMELLGKKHDIIIDRAHAATKLTLLWIITKLACLHVHLTKNKDYTPQQFAISQINESSQYYADCFDSILDIDASVHYGLLLKIHEELVNSIRRMTEYNLGVAYDEAHMMITAFEYGYFLAIGVDDSNEENYTKRNFRGLFHMISHLCIDLKDQYDYIAFAGTRLSLAEVEFTQCATGRQDPLNIFNEFPYYNGKSSIMQQFKCLVDMTDCDLSDESVSMLAGRPHILNYAIQLLEDSPSKLKTEVLEKAITDSYMSIRKFIVRSCTKQILMYRNPKAVVYWLFKFAITRAVDPKFVLATSKGQLFDFVHAGIFHLKFFKYSLFAVPSERLGLDVVYNLLEAFSAILPRDSLAYQVLQIDDATKARHVAQKGGFMETIIAECLLSEGRMDKLQTLAVTDHKEDMSWIKDFQFKEYGYATDLGVKNMENYHSEDFALLKEFVGGPRDAVLLRPKQNLGPNLLGLKKMMENGVLCKRIMWVSSKILQHYDDQIEDEPRKDVQKKFKEEIVPQLDLDRVLIVHVLHPEGNSDQRFTRSELEPGQVLINITLDNIQYLIEDAMVVSVIKEINNAEEVATEGAEKIFDANVVNDEEMTESNMKSNRQVKIRIMKTECKNSSCLTLLVDIGENTDHKERVKLWLLQSKLERFYEVFIEHGFDSLRQLIKRGLTDEYLKVMQITNTGDVCRLRNALKELQEA